MGSLDSSSKWNSTSSPALIMNLAHARGFSSDVSQNRKPGGDAGETDQTQRQEKKHVAPSETSNSSSKSETELEASTLSSHFAGSFTGFFSGLPRKGRFDAFFDLNDLDDLDTVDEGLAVPPHFHRVHRPPQSQTQRPVEAKAQSQAELAERTQSQTTSQPAEIVYDRDTYFPPMVNHIWSRDELERRKNNPTHYEPKTLHDKVINFLVTTVLYRGFNKLSGFDYEDPSVRACGLRLILLESIAGVPGMVAAVCRHFTSLRTLRRDHGWIHTLLEEAQNERMHLLICLKKFDAGLGTRALVCLSQYVMVTILSAVYLVHPRSLHRFVGYLEETAVKTYGDLIRITKTPGTRLNRAWAGGGVGVPSPAPKLAIAYWGLDEGATWVDVLEQLLADESHHRDVNHTFADLQPDDPNPYLVDKIRDLESWNSKRSYREQA